ncbi:hypothetical protein [Shewanella mangrovi]|uniref:hypothetical protein n=1 Tax=Shewanella mangrovi TaxID=1515746 RepID=UPI00068F57AA|nr:hypothetical protein [Shewanella mangrovi]
MKKLGYALCLLLAATSSASALELGFSGMARMTGDSYLVVQDKKVFETGDRVGIFQLSADGQQHYTPLQIDNWRDPDGPSSDLESVCQLPGSQNQYLLAESGYWDGKFGRIFRVELNGTQANVLQVYHVPKLIPSGKGKHGDNFEGMLCAKMGANTLVILGERGGSKAYRHGVLRIGVLQPTSIDWQHYAEQAVKVKAPKSWRTAKYRSISDLYLDNDGIIWAVATQDAGDNGPFRSVVYAAARLAQNSSKTPLEALKHAAAAWPIDGFKVEALAAPNVNVPGSVMSIGTEDEHFGGVWRPLFPSQNGTDD